MGSIRLRYYGRGVGFSGFFIDRRYQGKGFGRLALECLPGFILERYPDVVEIELCVHRDNIVAWKLFEQMGCRFTGVENADGTLDMEMSLDG